MSKRKRSPKINSANVYWELVESERIELPPDTSEVSALPLRHDSVN